MEFEEVELGQISNVTKLAGYEFTNNIKYTNDGDIIAIRALNIKNGKLDLSQVKKITKETSNNLLRSKLYKNDIVLTYTGSKYGEVALINQNEKFHLAPNVCKVTVASNVNPYYIFLIMQTRSFKIQMKNFGVGSSQPTIPMKNIRKLKILLPSLEHQNKIVKVLKSLDEKIDLNYKLVTNLEELSQTLFKRWFIDFEFPDKNGIPYKSSGGEMIDSELGKIPSNWKIYKLKDIASHKKETFNPKKSKEVIVKHFSLPAYDNEEQAIEEEVNKIKSNKWIINNNCVLFSKMNPDTKRIWLPVIDNKKLNVASSEFVVMESPNNKINSFIYNICLNSQFIDYLKANTTGSTNSRQRVKPTIAVNYKLAIEDSIVQKYSEIITPYMEEMKILRSEIGKLTQLRDTLLPKLMSGEIEIPDDIEVNMDEFSI